MKLYEYSVTRSVRCRWILNELGIPFESITIDLTKDEQKSPDFLKINPFGKIPVLDDDGFILTESAAICTYLADKYPEKNLVPGINTTKRGLYEKWMYFCMTELEQPLWTIAKHTRLYPEEKRIPQMVEIAKDEFKVAAKILNDELKSSEYILGDSFSAADIVIGQTMIWASWYALLDDFQGLNSYLGKIIDRKAFPREVF